MYESIYETLSKERWEDRTYDVLDFGSEWFGDPDGGWQTNMRWMFKALIGLGRLNHILGVFPEYDAETLLSVPSSSLDVVVADQVLEHVERPWRAAETFVRVLKPGGIAVVCTPGLYPVHPSPLDCWRIMPHGYDVLFPKEEWVTLKKDMWGTAERVAFEYSNRVDDFLSGAPTYTVDEALGQPGFKAGTDGKCPLQLWWIGKKR